jgi:hypothetical protein
MSDTTKLEAAARTYRDQCLFFLDSIANQNGFIAELLAKIKALEEAPPPPELAELQELVKCKDEQIVEQSNRIVALRAELETAKSECLG